MAWVYLDDQFPDHPKIVLAGGDAGWLWACGLAYVRRYSTRGLIPKGQIPKLSDRKSPMKLAARLVEVGLWEDQGDHYAFHDYGDWNKPQESRSAAGRKAAQARWSKDAQRNADADADACETHSEPASETGAETDASGCPIPIPIPIPIPGDLPTQPTHGGSRPDPAGRPAADSPSPDRPQDPNDLLTAAARLLASDETDRRSARGELDNPDGYQRSRVAPLRRDNEAFWRLAIDENPTVTARQLAAATQQRNTPAHVNGSRPDPLAGMQAAAMARAEAGMDHMRALAHEPPPDPDAIAAVTQVIDGIRDRIRRPTQETTIP